MSEQIVAAATLPRGRIRMGHTAGVEFFFGGGGGDILPLLSSYCDNTHKTNGNQAYYIASPEFIIFM